MYITNIVKIPNILVAASKGRVATQSRRIANSCQVQRLALLPVSGALPDKAKQVDLSKVG